jgi:hypothetical protein
MFNVHALFHAYHVTRTGVRDQRLAYYLNQGMMEIFPYLTFDKGIHAWKRRRHDDLPPAIEDQKTHVHLTAHYQK